jgi:hypothetical protein
MNAALLFLTLLAPVSLWAANFPERPPGPLFGNWTEEERALVEPLLVAHKSETGQEIMLAILEAPVELQALARWWRVGEQGSTAGELWAAQGGHIDCWSSEDACQKPTAGQGAPSRILAQIVLQALADRQSPVIDEEAYTKAVQYFGVTPQQIDPAEVPRAWPFVLVSLLLFGGVAAVWLPRDAHYTPEGWFKVRTFRVIKTPPGAQGAIDGHW